MNKLDEFLELIKNGKISIREASKQTGYGRDYLRSQLYKKYGTDTEAILQLDDLMANNKANSNTIFIKTEISEDIFLRTISGEITLAQAKDEITQRFGKIDMETLKANFLKFVQDNKNNESFLAKYREYKNSATQTSRGIEITKLNFRVLAIYMMRARISQTDLAHQIGVTPRTISRKFEEFKDDEDKSLYDMIKFYSDIMMKRKKLTEYQEVVLNVAIKAYEQRHPELLAEKKKSAAEEKLERIQAVVAEADRLQGEGLTQAEIASKLGTSVSTLRRARMFLEEQQLLVSNTKEKAKETTEIR